VQGVVGFLVNRFTANLPVKKFLKSVKNWQNHDHESVAPFLAHPAVCFVCCLHLSLHSESKIYLCNNFVRAMPIFRILSLLSSGIIYAHYSWIDSHDTSAMLSPLFFSVYLTCYRQLGFSEVDLQWGGK